MAKIKKITAREIINSDGRPTVEALLLLDTGQITSAGSPSGKLKSRNEPQELYDDDQTRHDGLGVKKAVDYINNLIGPKLIGASCESQTEIDTWLDSIDPSELKSTVGINTLFPVSQLIAKGRAMTQGVPLYKSLNSFYNQNFKKKTLLEKIPAPMFNLMSGSRHGGNNLDFLNFQIIPATSFSYDKALEIGVIAYNATRRVLKYRNADISLSDEGSFAPNLAANTDALEVIKEVITQNKMKLGIEAHIGIDLAASLFYSNGKYKLKDKPQALNSDDYIKFLTALSDEYGILLLEDPINDEDQDSWVKLSEKIGSNSYIIADNFLLDQKDMISKAAQKKICSGIAVKFNVWPTVTKLMAAVSEARDNGLQIIFSQRFAETNDFIIADMAVAIQADFVKFGPPVHGERVAKYNRLLTIQKEILSKHP